MEVPLCIFSSKESKKLQSPLSRLSGKKSILPVKKIMLLKPPEDGHVSVALTCVCLGGQRFSFQYRSTTKVVGTKKGS